MGNKIGLPSFCVKVYEIDQLMFDALHWNATILNLRTDGETRALYLWVHIMYFERRLQKRTISEIGNFEVGDSIQSTAISAGISCHHIRGVSLWLPWDNLVAWKYLIMNWFSHLEAGQINFLTYQLAEQSETTVWQLCFSKLNGSLVTTAWRVLRLRMEETPSRYGG
jgi:hypothetical protein